MSVLLSSVVVAPAAGQDVMPRVDAVFAEIAEADGPGCAVAAERDGRIVLEAGYGFANLEHRVPISPHSVFYAGSVSKQFVAASIALLAERGALSLDDDVRAWVPEVPDYGPTITLRHMLHHTSGLRDYLELFELAGREVEESLAPAEVLAMIARQRALNFPPGERHQYSNTGYFLLAEVVARVTGGSLRGFAAEEIFGPLGMRDSHFHHDNAHIITRRAEGYGRGDGAWRAWPLRFALVGSGGLYTTAPDLVRWAANLGHNRLGAGTPGFVDTLLTRGVLSSGDTIPYALGIRHGQYREVPAVMHGGALAGYRAVLVRFPSIPGSVAVLCNVAPSAPGAYAEGVADVLFADALGPARERPPRTTPERPVVAVDPAVYDTYEGWYVREDGLVLGIDRRDGRLWLDWPNLWALELHPESPTMFWQSFDSDRFSFPAAGDGAVERLVVHSGERETPLTRMPRLAPAHAARFTGRYVSEELDATYRVSVEDGYLRMQVEYGDSRPFHVVAGDRARILPGRIQFSRDASGRVTGFLLSTGGVQGVAFARR